MCEIRRDVIQLLHTRYTSNGQRSGKFGMAIPTSNVIGESSMALNDIRTVVANRHVASHVRRFRSK